MRRGAHAGPRPPGLSVVLHPTSSRCCDAGRLVLDRVLAAAGTAHAGSVECPARNRQTSRTSFRSSSIQGEGSHDFRQTSRLEGGIAGREVCYPCAPVSVHHRGIEMKRIVFVLSFAVLPLAGCPTAGGSASQPERLELQPGYFDPEAGAGTTG